MKHAGRVHSGFGGPGGSRNILEGPRGSSRVKEGFEVREGSEGYLKVRKGPGGSRKVQRVQKVPGGSKSFKEGLERSVMVRILLDHTRPIWTLFNSPGPFQT